MASINIRKIQEYVDSQKNWLEVQESPARECLVIEFDRDNRNIVVDEEMVGKTLYLQSNNGNVTICFDRLGLIKEIELS